MLEAERAAHAIAADPAFRIEPGRTRDPVGRTPAEADNKKLALDGGSITNTSNAGKTAVHRGICGAGAQAAKVLRHERIEKWHLIGTQS